VAAVSDVWGQRLKAMERHPWLGAGLVAAGIAAAALVTYLTGGTVNVFPHLFYIPVLMGGFFYGPSGGLAAGILAGVVCGPFMPLDVAAGIPQAPAGWIIRTVFFSGIGVTAGALNLSLRRRIDALHQLVEEAILAFVRALDAKDPYTSRHSEKVAEYAEGIAQAMNLPLPVRERLRWAALLHDVGKIAVPSAVLNKPGPLDPEEWEIMRRHPVESARICEGVAAFRPLLPGIRHHHERMDGRGYPDGLRGDEVPLEARIIAVADAFDAMTSRRAYRDALSEEEALRQLEAGAGTQFDPVVVAAMVRWRRALAAAQKEPPARVPA